MTDNEQSYRGNDTGAGLDPSVPVVGKRVSVVEDIRGRLLDMGYCGPFIMFLASMALGVFTVPLLLLSKDLMVFLGVFVMVVAEMLTVWFMVSYARQKHRVWDFLGLNNFHWKNALKGIFAGVGLLAVLIGVTFLLGQLGVKTDSSDTTQTIMNATGFAGIVTAFVLVPFIVPFSEELFFRGAVMHSLKEGYELKDGARTLSTKRKWMVVLITSLFFAAMHIQGFSTFSDLFVFLWVFCTSTVFGWLVMRTGSTWTSIFAHSTYNLLTVLVSKFGGA